MDFSEAVNSFNMFYATSDVKAALFRPIYDGSVVTDVEVLAANPEWVATRSVEFHPGVLGSEIHSDFQSMVLIDIRNALSTGATYSSFTPGETAFTRESSALSVSYRALDNGLVIVEAREIALAEQVAELSGPVLIVDLPDGPNSVPTNFLATNDAFRNLFLAELEIEVPSLSNYSDESAVPLSLIRDHVASRFFRTDWDEFYAGTAEAYLNGGSISERPFVFEDIGFARSYFTRRVEGRWIGVWLYRLADASEVSSMPEFALARSEALRQAVWSLERPTAAHRPVLDSDGNLVDLELLWANPNFDSYRSKASVTGDLASENRVRFNEGLLPYVQHAWSEGSAAQIFRFQPSDGEAGLYNHDYAQMEDEFGKPLEIETIFIRTSDDFVLEWGEDVRTKIKTGSQAAAQRRELEIRAAEAEGTLAKKEERESMGRELHDNILQELFVIGLSLAPFSKEDSAPLPSDMVAAVRDSLARVAGDIRALITNSKKDRASLITERIETLAEKWDEATENFKVSSHISASIGTEDLERIPAIVVENIIYIAKEAVANAVKHSQGTEVEVHAIISRKLITLAISDDGKGIADGVTRSSGTANIRKRALEIDADISTESSPTGTVVTLTAPFRIDAI